MHDTVIVREEKNVQECLDILSRYETRWLGSGRAVDVLRELTLLDDMAQDSVTKSPSMQSEQSEHDANGSSSSQTQRASPNDLLGSEIKVKPWTLQDLSIMPSFPTLDLDFLEQMYDTHDSMLF